MGKIYKITSSKTDNVYIGSTIQTLNDRFLKHKSNYKLYQNNKYANVSSNEILKHGDAKIELIEEKKVRRRPPYITTNVLLYDVCMYEVIIILRATFLFAVRKFI